MRKLITGMKVSLDGKIEGAEGMADWVQAWSEDYGLMPQLDACILGAGMYPGYERYWTTIRNEPDLSVAAPLPQGQFRYGKPVHHPLSPSARRIRGRRS